MLKTEMRNPATTCIDKMSCSEMVRVMQNENMNAVTAVEGALCEVAEAIEKISERMARGGRLFYVGCGTSGRLGVLDASECPPTFGVSKELVTGIIAGGDHALRNAIEGAEDNASMGEEDLASHCISELDCIVGISVAGGAEYVLGALGYAKERGALTVGLTSNGGSPLAEIAHIAVVTDTGAEVITGSSRMKAGTAHKMVLNMISTGVMVRLGCVYENLMINLRPSNKKLRARMIRITAELAGVDEKTAERLLSKNGFVIRAAVDAARGAE